MTGAGGVAGGIGSMLGSMISGQPSQSQPQSQGQQTQGQTTSQDPSSITVNPFKSSYDPNGTTGVAPWHQYLLDSQGNSNGH